MKERYMLLQTFNTRDYDDYIRDYLDSYLVRDSVEEIIDEYSIVHAGMTLITLCY